MKTTMHGPAVVGHYLVEVHGKKHVYIEMDENHDTEKHSASFSMSLRNPDSLRVMAQKLEEAADALEQEMLK